MVTTVEIPSPNDVADILAKYLPELSSEDTRDHLYEKLLRVAESGTDRLRPGQPAAPPPYDPARDSDGAFSDYFSHFVTLWSGPVRTAVETCDMAARGNTIVEDFVDNQAMVVAGIMTRTLLEELHERKVAGLLSGDTPEDRYRSYREWMSSEAGHAHLLNRYPYLFRFARRRVRSAADYLAHVIAETERNRDRLIDAIPGLGDSLRIMSIGLGEGDTHNGAKSVARILFADSGRVLYKPHPVEAEKGYNSFVAWINEGMGTHLRTIAVLPCDGGGFVEYVETEECLRGAEGYFAQIGQLAGILYLLKATDIHYENVVTCAAGPVVVDTETLLTPRLRLVNEVDAGVSLNAIREAHESVARIGILPMLVGVGDGFDVGAIGYDPGQRIPFKTLQLRNVGRDDMYIELGDAEMTAVNANPSVQSTGELPVRRQREIIKSEFSRVLAHALSNREEVCAAVEKYLGDVQLRYINNPTVFYSQLLRMATHPDAITDPLVRAAVLNRVALTAGADHSVADEEARQLSDGDVPYFSFRPRSCALSSGGKIVYPHAFEEPALETVRTRIRELGPDVVERQLRMIDLAFVNKLPPGQELTGFPGAGDGPMPRPSRSRYVQEAVRIGDAFVDTMIDGGGRNAPATWIAPLITVPDQRQWMPGSLGFELYGGSIGPALFLAGLARETGDHRYADAALRVFDPIEAALETESSQTTLIPGDGMTGLAGIVYALALARRLLGVGGRMTTGELASRLARRSDPRGEIDFVSGLAGTLSVCLALWRHADGGTDGRRAEDAARSVAGALIGAVRRSAGTDGRVTSHTGFAHGSMGIGPALLEYGVLFGDPDARLLATSVAKAALDAFDEQDGDWPRAWEEPVRSYAWCHGAPGMLLGALTFARHAPGLVSPERLARLAELTLERGFGRNLTYCHGDLGAAEIIGLAERDVPGLFGAGVVDQLYPRLFIEVLERYEDRNDNKYAYSNSFMVGRAGLAWSILRHLDPETYPSVLRFE
ncbi:type 2 lanthipeptide synthetase LanM family protein [Microbispora sp. CA-135349]|uniref:type 2 lanthipeptide synthetase LanM family protein n=1 Tax=Microbispora sp. CA-135349 TaxID=3239953 RepID=UPI003D8FE4BA